MIVAIRADASVLLGSGHVMRCAALGEALRAHGAQVIFICCEGDGDMAGWLVAAGFAVRRLAPDAGGWQDDAAATVAALASLKPDWLIVDHYWLDARWERQLAAHAGKILAIDDLANRPHACNVLLDQNFYPDAASRYEPYLTPDCLRLLGPGYALLRGEFGQAYARRRVRDGVVRRILCFFGGADAGNATGMALDALALLARPDIAVDVVIGAANPWRERIERQCGALPQARFHRQVSNMAELMQAADLCIGAGGSSSWERCCLGLPSVVLAVADNQVEVARALSDHGCLNYLGRAAEVTAASLAQALSDLLRDAAALGAMAERSATLVDAQGSERVAQLLAGAPAAQAQGPAPTLRRATPADESNLLEWRNGSEVRAASFDSHLLAPEEHRRWLRAVLANSARHLLVAEQAGQPVAVLRYDVSGAEAEVSIFLLPGLSGQGIGTRVLQEGSHWLRAHQPQVGAVRARILPTNPASRAAFLKAGYCASGDDYIFALRSASEQHTRTP
jgi:UDP-2,4-diacetamido-2,4,6-trideoxy-beta-L-altropyranose hydrolase